MGKTKLKEGVECDQSHTINQWLKQTNFKKPPTMQVSNPQHRCLQHSAASEKKMQFPAFLGCSHTLKKEAQKGGME